MVVVDGEIDRKNGVDGGGAEGCVENNCRQAGAEQADTEQIDAAERKPQNHEYDEHLKLLYAFAQGHLNKPLRLTPF